ncbi:AraC family transcriptional regulator ligand-binding domain-containing protein [Nocardioides zeae]
MTADQELTVVRALLRRRPDDPPARLGSAIGSSYHLGSFGVFGFAMLASPTLLHAVDLATRYIDLSFTFAMPRAELEGDAGTGTVRVHVDGATLPPDVRPLLVARDARAIGTALRELLPDLPLELRLEPVEGPAGPWCPSRRPTWAGRCRRATRRRPPRASSCARSWSSGAARAAAWRSRCGCSPRRRWPAGRPPASWRGAWA